MTTRYKLISLLVIAIACVIGFIFASAKSDSIHITMRSFIRAGDAVQITMQVDNAVAGDTIAVTLANGLNVIDATLMLGTGGVAIWKIPEDIVTNAGISMLIVQYQDFFVRQQLRVLPTTTQRIDILSTSNNIIAYGEESTTIMILPEDGWGNVPSDADLYNIHMTYPDTQRVTDKIERFQGIGLYQLVSRGLPGRVRIEATMRDVEAQFELMQIPSVADNLRLTMSSLCVLNDGRDIITLNTHVSDQYDQAVTDGTLVTIYWDDGLGYARTIDGMATLRLPAFSEAGEYKFWAQVNDVTSPSIILRVVEESCLE